VIGFHFVGPNAGEITQGFGLAVRLGAKKADFDKLVSAPFLCCGGLGRSLFSFAFFRSWALF